MASLLTFPPRAGGGNPIRCGSDLDWMGATATDTPRLPIPLFAHSVPAGFPSPADDYIQDRLDLNQLLIENPSATFFLRVKGSSMVGAGIMDGDIIVVDRSIIATDRSIVVAVVDGELTIKRLHFVHGRPELHAENPEFAPIRFKDGQELSIWGVVTNAIHTVR